MAYEKVALPQGVRIAAERFASACERDGCGGLVASVGAEQGKVIWVSFYNERLGVNETLFRTHDGAYMKNVIPKEALDGQPS